MAEEDIEDGELEDELTEGLERKRLSGKKIVVIAAPVLLLVIGAAVFFLMGGGDKAEEGETEEVAEAAEPAELIFVELPEMLVNLNTGSSQPNYLKIKVALEVDGDTARAELEAKLPRVIDNFQIYLRELRLEDLSGSAGAFRLKEELLLRINQSVAPTQVKDVLFKEMLVQ